MNEIKHAQCLLAVQRYITDDRYDTQKYDYDCDMVIPNYDRVVEPPQ